VRHSATTTNTSPGRDVSTKDPPMQVRGGWLLLARVGWIAVTLTIIALNAIAMPSIYAHTLPPGEVANLRQLGLSSAVYNGIEITESILYMLVYLATAAVIFFRRSDERMALFCAFTLVIFGCASTGGNLYDISSGTVPAVLAANPIAHLVTLLFVVAGQAMSIIFFYLFPSGRFVPRWTRWISLIVLAFWLAALFVPTLPAGVAGGMVIPTFIVTVGIAQVYRYLRISTPKERQQTKWIVYCFSVITAVFVAFALAGVFVPDSVKQASPVIGNLVIGSILQFSLMLIPIFITIAILRARLWDIDTIINKTLVYGSLTVLLAGVYAVLVVGLESLAGITTGRVAGGPVALVISTLATAALIQPARRRLQTLIDRRFYRRKYNAEKTLAAFSATLRNGVNLNEVRTQLLAMVQETMEPEHISLWLSQPGQRQPD
jgi:hypothetical protein